ncbi:MAG: hypothetical protein A2W93_14400 [Bacteroidetes bacterium GWF2_43_63]|nr:MAG: hypothetical protein A2W94_00970 [Bacteroidetes bacterium GWE2_42_42]OFY52531.1 MAG: hypothetical protein A2W93_14400 [Bacteroidetes bacterium GWF2_43_63]HBG71439.1 hypothetical protein [Bacteroidales bacterium]HCB60809.1 hypothetical protein [Bacteroidales bacterium]HCY23466.1 hypothetical protein [Bacteroidales bacterium]
MKTEIIKRTIVEVTGETVSDVIDSIIENLKSNKELRNRIGVDFWKDNFEPEELTENNILINGEHEITSGCYSIFGTGRVTVTGKAHVNVFGRGYGEIKDGTAQFFNYSNGRAETTSSVRAFDYTHMRLHHKAVGEYHDFAQGETYGDSDASAYDNSFVRITGKSVGIAKGKAIVMQTGKTKCVYCDNSIGRLHGDATAEAWGKAHLVLKNESTAKLFEDSDCDALNDSTVVASGRSMVVAKNAASVTTKENSAAQLHERAIGNATGNSIMTLHDTCYADGSENATIKMFEKSRASVSGQVSVEMSGDNMLDINSDGIQYHVTRDANGIVRNNATMELVLHGHKLQVIEK